MIPDETKNNNYNEKIEYANINAVTTYPETTKLPDLIKTERKNEGENIANKLKSTIYKSNSFVITNLNTDKFNFDINDCIFESKMKIKNVCNFAKRILYMKIFQGIQRNNTLNSFVDKNFNELRKYIKRIDTNFEKYKQICKIYNYRHFAYYKFLKKTVVKMDEENKSLNGEIMKLEVDDLLNANIRTQRELEKLIDMRNFIYKVRHKDEQIPDIYSTFYIESKRYVLAKLLIKLYHNLNNITVMKYLIDIPEIISESSNINQSQFFVKHCPPLLDDVNVQLNVGNRNKKNKIKEEKSNKTFFSSDDEFINIFKTSEEYNRELLNKNGSKLDLIEKYKEELENSISHEEIVLREKFNKIIKIKEKELEKIKQKNLMLNNEFNDAYNKISKINLFTKNNKSLSRKD